ncbi:uncharacterized protein BDV14DRAFT_199262 [Aspergillus stella-maris]|uniref:uncharacterized protein n=1 Tax=Aspergillus stella-maris TaxID=1810926 RepID=UPI003CCDFFC9
MVSLDEISASNAKFASAFPAGLVGVFVGATSGIGYGTLKAFAKHTVQPRAYFVGRSQSAANAISAECQELNPGGEYIFIQADVSLIKVVDDVCSQIREKESALNILCLSQGQPSLDRSVTTEGLHLLAALGSYSRLRFMSNLLPLLKKGESLRRVLTVGAGGFEGQVDTSDFPALRIPHEQIRGHLASVMTFGLEAVSRDSPNVSFIHSYPGAVNTPLTRQLLASGNAAPIKIPVLEDWLSPEESGERHIFLLTSSRYPPRARDESTSLGTSDDSIARGIDGQVGSGVYSVGVDGENVSTETIDFLAELRGQGIVDKLWEHNQGEFKRITAANGL